ncbi:MAG: SCO family protein [Candidatus Aminicenantaceae bacterium]
MIRKMIKSKILAKLFLIVFSCLFSVSFFACKSTTEDYPVIKKASDFTLINQDNEQVSLNQFSDKIVFLSFIYIRCPSPKMCPLTTKNFQRIQESLEADLSDNVVFLIITFDPETDTPEALKRYGEMYGTDFHNWHFLTGDVPAIDKVCEDYGIIHERKEDGLIRHSVKALLIDQKNHVRKIYIGNQWTPEEIKEDIIKLLD